MISTHKEDSLWMKWIHYVYIRSENWWSYKSPDQGSWYWSRLVTLKDQFIEIIAGQYTSIQPYCVAKGYHLLWPNLEKVTWSQQVWGRLNTPKYSFITWIAIQNRLKTRDMLLQMGISGEDQCVLCCQHRETSCHLFFECSVAAECLKALKDWLQWHATTVSLSRLIRWIGRAKMSKFKKQVLAASTTCLVHVLWRARNSRLWEDSHEGTDCLIQKIKHTVKQRITQCWPRKVKERDKEWFQSL
ncbi:hypothetical protein CsatB_017410 [Cannabis sativa]|uniref:uncharacterized protein LOC115710412 n=1 Tax=Cannabis sativa TaxID=3483 RepID=UPI0029CA42C9|nr:uncharacterized protein LOC115710412 [Cannabis sativa]